MPALILLLKTNRKREEKGTDKEKKGKEKGSTYTHTDFSYAFSPVGSVPCSSLEQI